MDGFRFYSPQWFALLPLAIAVIIWSRHPRHQSAAVFSSLTDLKRLPVTVAQHIRRLFPFVYMFGFCLLILALARPQSAKSESQIRADGIAIELALDISGSMEAMDFQINEKDDSRLNAIKHVIKQFIAGSKKSGLSGRMNDLVGVVAFAGFADARCPLTLDHGALLDVVQQLETPKLLRDRRGKPLNEQSYREEQMTAIGDGLSLALDRLRNVDTKSKVVILLSDGDNNAGVVDPREAAKAARQLGVRVYAIGIGRTGYAPMPYQDEFGDRILQPTLVRLNEELLRGIAESASGQYFNATSTKALTDIYAEIDQLEKSKVEEIRYTEYQELYLWAAISGLALILVVGFLEATRFRSLP
ncbi:MAG: VWA domain-containing protein [Planctomycetota bacterium]